MKNWNFLSLISISFILSIPVGCKKKQSGLYYHLSVYLEKKHNCHLSSDIKNVLILTSNNCINCNKSYSNFISNNLGKINFKNTLVIIRASSASIDLSVYPENNNKIIFDDDLPGADYSFLDNSAYIKFSNDGDVDTVVAVNSITIDRKLDYIAKQIN